MSSRHTYGAVEANIDPNSDPELELKLNFNCNTFQVSVQHTDNTSGEVSFDVLPLGHGNSEMQYEPLYTSPSGTLRQTIDFSKPPRTFTISGFYLDKIKIISDDTLTPYSITIMQHNA